MWKALATRVLRALATLLLSSFAIFGALYITPGSPIGFLTGGKPLSPEQLKAVEQQYHLDDPFLQRYWDWLTGILHGDLGQSIVFQTDVGSLLSSRAPTTLFLVVYAALLIVGGGVLLGVISAVRGRLADGAITISTTVGLATPSFVMAVLLVFVFGVQLSLFPVLGAGSGFTDRLWHLTLPAIALAVGGIGYVAQTSRAAVVAELHKEHVETARSRGFPERLVIRRHVLRNAMIPITTVCGLAVASLVAGVAVVEKAFGLEGIGSYLITAVSQKDFPVVQAISLILVTVFIVINTVVDLLYMAIDPRMRLGGGSR